MILPNIEYVLEELVETLVLIGKEQESLDNENNKIQYDLSNIEIEIKKKYTNKLNKCY